MKSIYSESTTTFVYLGEPKELGNWAVDLGHKIVAMTKKFDPGVQIAVSKLEEYGLPPIESPYWIALYDLLCQPWFRRAWVMQEYILSREILVLYGGVWRPSEFYVSINEALGAPRHNGYGLDEVLRSIPSRLPEAERFRNVNWSPSADSLAGNALKLAWLDVMRQSLKRGGRVQDPLLRLHETKTTDPRDYIYGILGLMEEADTNHPDLLPDYVAPVSETFIRAARYLLDKEGLPYLFEIVGFPQSIESLPSWVPDWSKTKLRSSLDFQGVKQEFTAGGVLPPVYRLTGDGLPDKLTIHGIILDVVEKIETIFGYQDPLSLSEAYKRFFMNTSKFVKQSTISKSGSELAYAHIITLTLAQSSANLPFSEFEAISQILEPFYNEGLLNTTPEQKARIAAFLTKVTVDSAFLGFCLTKRGNVGRVPHNAMVGDKVCFFQGISKPFIVRAHEQRPDEYILIGQCYIYGKMRGEVFQGEGLDIQEITLV